jgi:hypothetical protein
MTIPTVKSDIPQKPTGFPLIHLPADIRIRWRYHLSNLIGEAPLPVGDMQGLPVMLSHGHLLT